MVLVLLLLLIIVVAVLLCLGMALKAPPPEECLAGTLVALGSRFTPDLQAEI